jgi:hypothetical protein
MAERGTVNVKTQIGVESTAGTSVAANKVLQAYDFKVGIKPTIQMVGASGRKYPASQLENKEWVGGTLTGSMDFNHLPYLLSSAWGIISPVAHGASATAKDWVGTPPVTGSTTPQTYTFEQGETATRAHKFTYGLVNKFGYKFTREMTECSGDLIGQPLSDGITMTGSPTLVALAPIASKYWNVYLDATSAGLGTTQLVKTLSFDYEMGNIYLPAWFVNRATLGFTSHVDGDPTCVAKLLLEADAQGMALLSTMQTGATGFLRAEALGLIIDNVQTLTFGGGVTGGNFTLTYKGQTTANIAYSAALTSATVNTAFQLLSTVGANCTVTGSAGGPYTFTFSGALATDMSPVTATNVSLTGGTPTMTLVARANNYFAHDMAVKVSNVTDFSDSGGVFAIEWELTIVEDGAWGKAQTATTTNLITAL